uniref:Uncharacterized protein n=1 Tax=Arundo donax TaxID=35708 RepID=A0A0A9A213_ARUDO
MTKKMQNSINLLQVTYEGLWNFPKEITSLLFGPYAAISY